MIKNITILGAGESGFGAAMLANQKDTRQSHLGKVGERTIGYEKVDESGNYTRIGLEGAYSEYLTGKSGLRLMQKIADGQWKPIRPYYEREPVQGYDVHTTIVKLNSFIIF